MAQDRMSWLLITVDADVIVSLSECSLHDGLEEGCCVRFCSTYAAVSATVRDCKLVSYSFQLLDHAFSPY